MNEGVCPIEHLKEKSLSQLNKTTYQELQRKQNFTLEEKEEYSLMRIKQFVEEFEGKCYVSDSGGIDSTVLRHLVRRLYPDMLSVFCNTTIEYPELVEYIKKTSNLKILTPKMNFKQIVKKYGFPFVSKMVSRSINDLRHPTDNPNVRNLYLTGLNRKNQFVASYKLAYKWYYLFDKEVTKFDITSICCDILKKEPIERFEKETGLKSIVGTLASESQQRKKNYIKYGCNIYDSKNPKSRPLSIWSDKDIWDYVKKYNLDYCVLYDDIELEDGTILKGETSTGCAGCGMGCHLEKEDRFKKLKLRNPKFFNYVMNMSNNNVTFKDALEHYRNPNKAFREKNYVNSVLSKGLKDLEGYDLEYKKHITKETIKMANEVKFTKEQQEHLDAMIQQAVDKQNKELELKTQQREENKVLLGCKVLEKNIIKGAPIIDKDTKQQKLLNGVPQCYPDRYRVKLMFLGGELEQNVEDAQYEMLEEYKSYYCNGHVGEVNNFGNTYIGVKLTNFVKI